MLSITRATPVVTVTWVSPQVFDGGTHPASASVAGVGSPAADLGSADSFTYYDGGTVSGSGSSTPPTNVGTYTMVAHFNQTANYSAADSAPKVLSITRATPVVTVTWMGWTFDNTAHLATGSVAGVGTPAANLGSPDSFSYYNGSTGSGTALAAAPKDAGDYSVVAHFNQTANYSAADSAVKAVTVAKRSTATTVSSSVNPSRFGQSVTFTAVVSSSITLIPGGSVQWKIDGANVGSAVSLAADGSATLVRSDLSVTTHSVTAVYSGSTNFVTSTGYLTGGQVVNQADTTTAVASSKSPTVFGESVTFTATVSAVLPGAGTPGGSIQWRIDGTNVGSPVAMGTTAGDTHEE